MYIKANIAHFVHWRVKEHGSMGVVLFVRADEMRADKCSDIFYAMPVICREDLVVLADITF